MPGKLREEGKNSTVSLSKALSVEVPARHKYGKGRARDLGRRAPLARSLQTGRGAVGTPEER